MFQKSSQLRWVRSTITDISNAVETYIFVMHIQQLKINGKLKHLDKGRLVLLYFNCKKNFLLMFIKVKNVYKNVYQGEE